MKKEYKKLAKGGIRGRFVRMSESLERHKSAASWASLLLSLLAVGTSTALAVRATNAAERSEDAVIEAFGTQMKLVMSDWNDACTHKDDSQNLSIGGSRPRDLDLQFPELERVGREIRVEHVRAESLRAFMRLRLLATRLATIHANHTAKWQNFLDQEKSTDPPDCVFLMVAHDEFAKSVDDIVWRIGK